MAVNRAIREIRAKKSLPLIGFSAPADSRSPEIRLLISGEQIAINRATRLRVNTHRQVRVIRLPCLPNGMKLYFLFHRG